jgi:FAD/FMN-containing dehydrogenase
LGKNGVKTEEIDEWVQSVLTVKINSSTKIHPFFRYNVDFMHWYKGRTPCVLFPTNSQQVSAILRHCYERKLAIVPQAGNTGLVGGSTPVNN